MDSIGFLLWNTIVETAARKWLLLFKLCFFAGGCTGLNSPAFPNCVISAEENRLLSAKIHGFSAVNAISVIRDTVNTVNTVFFFFYFHKKLPNEKIMECCPFYLEAALLHCKESKIL